MKFAISMLSLSVVQVFLAYFTMNMCLNHSKQWWVMAILAFVALCTDLKEKETLKKGDSA